MAMLRNKMRERAILNRGNGKPLERDHSGDAGFSDARVGSSGVGALRALHLDNFEDEEQRRDEQEQEANRQARAWLIDQDAFESWVACTSPYFSRRAIERFAADQQIHPGIFLGRLMFDGTVSYKHLRTLLRKVSPYLRKWTDSSGR